MHIKPKKALGQNFLIDANIQRKIIAACNLESSDIVLEIGAGKGELTSLIAGNVKKVYAVEIDTGLFQRLRNKFYCQKNIILINQDILKLDFKKYFWGGRKRIKVIGNIPYYISSPIMERLFNFPRIIDSIFITVQKEFALRMAGLPGSRDYSALSCFTQYYSESKILFYIKKTCFLPQPKVDSAFVRMAIRRKPLADKKRQRLFFKIVRAAFNKRRKTLRNSLKEVVPLEKLTCFFSEYRINPNTRPEGLTLSNFLALAKIP